MFVIVISLNFINQTQAQSSDPTVSLVVTPSGVKQGDTTTLIATLSNPGNRLIEGNDVTFLFWYDGSPSGATNLGTLKFDTSGVATFVFSTYSWHVPAGSTLIFRADFRTDIPADGYWHSYSSNTASLSVGPTLEAPEYPLGAILALIACFGAFIIFKKTRTSSSSKFMKL